MFDAAGARLFACLATTREHGLVRREQAILDAHAGDIAEALGERVRLVNLTTGDGIRSAQLLRALRARAPAALVLGDRAPGAASRAARLLAPEHADVPIVALEDPSPWTTTLPAPPVATARTALVLGGSVLGELEPRELRAELARLVYVAGPGGALVAGIDLRSDPRAHEAAYADSGGIAAAFAKNLLARINRELGADFDLGAFTHEAVYDADRGRVELRLVSTRWQWVAVGGHWWNLCAGEPITTLIAYKYTIEWFSALAHAAGFRTERVFLDPSRSYAVVLLGVSGRPSTEPSR